MTKIIVLTPIKNESWILDRFLSVTSQFSEAIIIADQNSTDGSLEIYKKYPKVIVIENPGQKYDEASRQVLLINKARELFPGPKILLALDSDEILAANSINTNGWQTMLNAAPGTVLFFEKPELYLGPGECIRYRSNLWPLGFVDDGTEHNPKLIHSIRIPMKTDSAHLYLHDVVVMHYALTRPDCQRAKFRLYSVVENVKGVNPFYRRRLRYGKDYYLKYDAPVENTPNEWFEKWEELGIDMKSIQRQKYYWNDIEVLKYFNEFGYKRFWMDDIWDMNWEELRQIMIAAGEKNIPNEKILPPPKYLNKALKLFEKLMLLSKRIS